MIAPTRAAPRIANIEASRRRDSPRGSGKMNFMMPIVVKMPEKKPMRTPTPPTQKTCPASL